MTAADILKDIKNRKFKPIYLLHGEESYYIDLIAEALENTVLSEAERGFNMSIFYGKDTDPVNVLNAAKRFPMMSDYQVILVKEAQDLKFDKIAESFQAYCEKPLQSTILILCHKHGKFDKRKKVYKVIEKTGLVFESATIYENKIPAWIDDFVKSRGYHINPKASQLLAEYLGNDLSKISNEVEKLMLNVPQGQEIGTKEIQDNIGISKEFNVFELQSALGKKDILKANQIINYFEANPKSNPLVLVMGNLYTYFSKILKYHYLQDKSEAARVLGVNPYFVKDYELAARNYSWAKVFDIISILREYDIKSKGVDSTGNTTDGDLMKELVWKIVH
ncbi:DNA polymerase III, delta subunit [Pseudopedobacter saltans DSM 12145]|uniref:DNA polymerase III subunit delta n=1 Tax=Pseudopedobacter saltans (strain ATCC 51119 / DSM 12145 / JCM 21818 / CCUG 39354 / LMG 10337 / NBRC 100064 / NCIMB 13643) TaxID=762903 RepID=F0S5B7_PSESL|nr:DNA polymerase III subunit delta [Pseudopedobacter saltans]ADY52062.1 DNA polymerase III, delta subunit [Pseudopedobacter saltans DSM 12145]